MNFPSAMWIVFLTLVGCAMGELYAGVEIIRDGRPQAKIYIHPNDLKPVNGSGGEGHGVLTWIPPDQIVNELNYHLQKMSGTALQVVQTENTGDIQNPAIVVGELAVQLGAQPQKTVESGEGFRLLTKDNRVLIGGQSRSGTLLGVHQLLRNLGCDWIMPGEIGEVIPTHSTITIDDIDQSQAPDFLFRKLWYHGGYHENKEHEDERFYLWQSRQMGGVYWPAVLNTGSHAWEGIVPAHKKLFEENPDMLALRRAPDGTLKRMGPQLESTNPKLVQLFVDDIRDAYRKNIAAGIWTKDTPAGFAIGPADGLGFSISTESQLAGAGRMDPITGEPDQTDLLVLLGNRILDQVHDEYPNALVGFYSYSAHEEYPARYKPHPNLVITFAPISFSRYHSLLDDHSKTQPYYRGIVEQWGKLAHQQGNKLVYRGYNWNLAENMVPFSKARIWGEELPWYRQQGIMGLYVEAAKCWSVLGPSDYIFMRLAWDTSQKWQDLLHEFCQHAYGDGAAPMEQYFLSQIDRQSSAGQEAGSYFAIHLIYDQKWVEESQKLLDAAAAAAQTDAQKTRIQYIGYALDALRLYLRYHAATLRFDFPAAQSDYEAMIAHYQKTHDINSDLVSDYVPIYLTRFIADFAGQAATYASTPYQIVQPLPDALPTLFDPNAAGDRMNFQGPLINDSSFIRTRTYSTTWDAQGLGALRGGAVWYRFHFDLDPALKGKPVGLFLGGVDDEAKVFLNGHPIGSSGEAFSVPFVFDLTEHLSPDGKNLLAIQVVHNTGLNELGTGGILRPSFLFTGPRLQQQAPQPLKPRRLLPGGAVDEQPPQ